MSIISVPVPVRSCSTVHVGSPHHWRGEACVRGRATVTIVCVFEMQWQAEIERLGWKGNCEPGDNELQSDVG